jgi:hypothetical protein
MRKTQTRRSGGVLRRESGDCVFIGEWGMGISVRVAGGEWLVKKFSVFRVQVAAEPPRTDGGWRRTEEFFLTAARRTRREDTTDGSGSDKQSPPGFFSVSVFIGVIVG